MDILIHENIEDRLHQQKGDICHSFRWKKLKLIPLHCLLLKSGLGTQDPAAAALLWGSPPETPCVEPTLSIIQGITCNEQSRFSYRARSERGHHGKAVSGGSVMSQKHSVYPWTSQDLMATIDRRTAWTLRISYTKKLSLNHASLKPKHKLPQAFKCQTPLCEVHLSHTVQAHGDYPFPPMLHIPGSEAEPGAISSMFSSVLSSILCWQTNVCPSTNVIMGTAPFGETQEEKLVCMPRQNIQPRKVNRQRLKTG